MKKRNKDMLVYYIVKMISKYQAGVYMVHQLWLQYDLFILLNYILNNPVEELENEEKE